MGGRVPETPCSKEMADAALKIFIHRNHSIGAGRKVVGLDRMLSPLTEWIHIKCLAVPPHRV